MKYRKHHLPSLLALMVPAAVAFSAVSPEQAKHSPPEKKQNFHQVLQRVGKTVFRPGGSAATFAMHEWLTDNNNNNNTIGPGDVALEISAGLGTGGMALAAKRKCHVVLTDQDEDRLKKASEMAQTRGLSDLIQTRRMDMNKIGETLSKDEHFQVAIVEASLSHQPDKMKEKILLDLKEHTDQILLHEIGLRSNSEEEQVQVRKDVGAALAIGFHPLSLQGWRELLDRCGYEITHFESGPIRVLNPKNMLQDEGPAGMAKIAWNLATHPDLRERVVSTRKVVHENRDGLGFVILRAVCKETRGRSSESS